MKFKASDRNTLDVSDIPGAIALPRTYNRSAKYESFLYKDVMGRDGYQVKQRNVDPQNPTYTVLDENGKGYQIGPIEFAKFKPTP